MSCVPHPKGSRNRGKQNPVGEQCVLCSSPRLRWFRALNFVPELTEPRLSCFVFEDSIRIHCHCDNTAGSATNHRLFNVREYTSIETTLVVKPNYMRILIEWKLGKRTICAFHYRFDPRKRSIEIDPQLRRLLAFDGRHLRYAQRPMENLEVAKENRAHANVAIPVDTREWSEPTERRGEHTANRTLRRPNRVVDVWAESRWLRH